LSFILLIRLGLRQFAAGMLSVISLGILNRVMKVELGLDLSLVSFIIGVHYFAAPLAIPLGHRSDRIPLFGLYRTPYILAGTGLTVFATLAAPFAALYLGDNPESIPAVILALVVFILLGTGMYTAGTAYLSLITDLTSEKERGKAIAVVWSMMMMGILAGVFFGVNLLDQYSTSRLIALFTVMGILIAIFTLTAVWKIERRVGSSILPQAVSTREAWDLVISGNQTRLFFVFLFFSILFLFLQNAVLEPFGGDVFGMTIAETTRFNAFQMVGVLGGMALAGRWLSKSLGDKVTAGLGILLACIAFLSLTWTSIQVEETWLNPSILAMGVGMGFFNVGGLAMMMGMSVEGRTGIYMGAWTLSQALANGLASFGGGVIHDTVHGMFGSEPIAYAAVFLVEALGLIITFILLTRLSLKEFRHEALSSTVANPATG
jgi:BCD family chlorophyll transporter-like MFS transporter